MAGVGEVFIGIGIRVDASGAVADIERVSAALRGLQAAAVMANGSVSTATAAATANTAKMQQSLVSSAAMFKNINASTVGMSRNFGTVGAATNKMNGQFIASAAAMSAMGNNFKSTFSSADVYARNLGMSVKSVGRAATGVGVIGAAAMAPIAYGMYKATRAALDWEDGVYKVGSAISATTEEQQKMMNLALDSSTKGRFNTKQNLDAMYQLSSAGANYNDIMRATPAILSYATATQSDLAESSDLVVAAMKQNGDGFDKAAKYANVFTAAVNWSMATTDKLATTLAYAGPVMSSYGNGIERQAAAYSLLYDRGLDASTVGTSLRMGMIQLSKETLAHKNVLEKYGMAYDDINPSMNDFYTILTNISKVSEFQDVGKLVGAPASTAWYMMSRPENIAAMKQYEDRFTGTNEAFRTANEQMKSAPGHLMRLRGEAEKTAYAIYEELRPDLVDFADWMSAEMPSMSTAFSKSVQGMLPGVKSFMGQVGGLMEGFANLDSGTQAAIGNMVSWLPAVTATSLGMGAVLRPMGDLIYGMGAVRNKGSAVIDWFRQSGKAAGASGLADEFCRIATCENQIGKQAAAGAAGISAVDKSAGKAKSSRNIASAAADMSLVTANAAGLRKEMKAVGAVDELGLLASPLLAGGRKTVGDAKYAEQIAKMSKAEQAMYAAAMAQAGGDAKIAKLLMNKNLTAEKTGLLASSSLLGGAGWGAGTSMSGAAGFALPLVAAGVTYMAWREMYDRNMWGAKDSGDAAARGVSPYLDALGSGIARAFGYTDAQQMQRATNARNFASKDLGGQIDALPSGFMEFAGNIPSGAMKLFSALSSSNIGAFALNALLPGSGVGLNMLRAIEEEVQRTDAIRKLEAENTARTATIKSMDMQRDAFIQMKQVSEGYTEEQATYLANQEDWNRQVEKNIENETATRARDYMVRSGLLTANKDASGKTTGYSLAAGVNEEYANQMLETFTGYAREQVEKNVSSFTPADMKELNAGIKNITGMTRVDYSKAVGAPAGEVDYTSGLNDVELQMLQSRNATKDQIKYVAKLNKEYDDARALYSKLNDTLGDSVAAEREYERITGKSVQSMVDPFTDLDGALSKQNETVQMATKTFEDFMALGGEVRNQYKQMAKDSSGMGAASESQINARAYELYKRDSARSGKSSASRTPYVDPETGEIIGGAAETGTSSYAGGMLGSAKEIAERLDTLMKYYDTDSEEGVADAIKASMPSYATEHLTRDSIGRMMDAKYSEIIAEQYASNADYGYQMRNALTKTQSESFNVMKKIADLANQNLDATKESLGLNRDRPSVGSDEWNTWVRNSNEYEQKQIDLQGAVRSAVNELPQAVWSTGKMGDYIKSNSLSSEEMQAQISDLAYQAMFSEGVSQQQAIDKLADLLDGESLKKLTQDLGENISEELKDVKIAEQVPEAQQTASQQAVNKQISKISSTLGREVDLMTSIDSGVATQIRVARDSADGSAVLTKYAADRATGKFGSTGTELARIPATALDDPAVVRKALADAFGKPLESSEVNRAMANIERAGYTKYGEEASRIASYRDALDAISSQSESYNNAMKILGDYTALSKQTFVKGGYNVDGAMGIGGFKFDQKTGKFTANVIEIDGNNRTPIQISGTTASDMERGYKQIAEKWGYDFTTQGKGSSLDLWQPIVREMQSVIDSFDAQRKLTEGMKDDALGKSMMQEAGVANISSGAATINAGSVTVNGAVSGGSTMVEFEEPPTVKVEGFSEKTAFAQTEEGKYTPYDANQYRYQDGKFYDVNQVGNPIQIPTQRVVDAYAQALARNGGIGSIDPWATGLQSLVSSGYLSGGSLVQPGGAGGVAGWSPVTQMYQGQQQRGISSGTEYVDPSVLDGLTRFNQGMTDIGSAARNGAPQLANYNQGITDTNISLQQVGTGGVDGIQSLISQLNGLDLSAPLAQIGDIGGKIGSAVDGIGSQLDSAFSGFASSAASAIEAAVPKVVPVQIQVQEVRSVVYQNGGASSRYSGMR